jgi:hypothetical protein
MAMAMASERTKLLSLFPPKNSNFFDLAQSTGILWVGERWLERRERWVGEWE